MTEHPAKEMDDQALLLRIKADKERYRSRMDVGHYSKAQEILNFLAPYQTEARARGLIQ